MEIAAQRGDEPQENGGEEIGDHGGQHIAGDAHIERDQEQYVQADGHNGAQHAIQRIQLGVFFGLDELGAHRVEGAHQHIDQHQHRVAVDGVQQVQKRAETAQDGKAAQHREDARGEHGGFV